MNTFIHILLLYSSLFSGVWADQNHQPDNETLYTYSTTGECMLYLINKDNKVNSQKEIESCKNWCPTQPNYQGCYGCNSTPYSDVLDKPDQISGKFQDDVGAWWVPAKCFCDGSMCGLAEDILSIVIEGLKQLGDILCAVFLTAINAIVETAFEVAFPEDFLAADVGKWAVNAVEGAKTIAENGLDISAFFGNWVGAACHIDNWPLGQGDIFDLLISAPSAFGKSQGCKKKGGCKPLPKEKPSPTKTEPTVKATETKAPEMTKKPPATTEVPKTTDKPENTGNPRSTEKLGTTDKAKSTDKITESSSHTSSAAACALGPKRRAALPPKRKAIKSWGEDETSIEACTKTHITTTDKTNIGWHTKEYPKDCPGNKIPQACYHYRSVMSVFTHVEDMRRFTCGKYSIGLTGTATADWGSTAIPQAPKKVQGQHWFAWANGPLTRKDTKPKGRCDRDEWPPRYFWPGDKEAASMQPPLSQRVRFLPSDQNQKAGHLWAKFCDNNGPISIKYKDSASKTEETWIISKYITTTKSVTRSEVDKNKPPTTIYHTTAFVETERPVFYFDSWGGLPDVKDHGMKDNSLCWPEALIPEDPGFALLTYDEWYSAGQHPELAIHTKSYQQLPDKQRMKDWVGQLQAKKVPQYDTTSINDAQFTRAGLDKWIDDDWRLILPGMPPPPSSSSPLSLSSSSSSSSSAPVKKPPRQLTARRNATAGEEKQENWWSPDGDDDYLDDYTDEDLNRWMEDYLSWARREESARASSGLNSPQETQTQAQPTPEGQGDPTPIPAIEAWAVETAMPIRTGNPV